MSPLTCLPFELLQKIAVELPDFDRRNLWATCSQTNAVLVSQVFEKLTIHVSQDRLPFCVDILQALATHRTARAPYVKYLKITSLSVTPFSNLSLSSSPPFRLDPSKLSPTEYASMVRDTADQVDMYLKTALMSLQNVRSVHWKIPFKERPIAVDTVSTCLSHMSRLEDFQLHGAALAEPRAPTLSLRSLRSLSITISDSPDTALDILSPLLMESPGLTSLTLNNIGSVRKDTSLPRLQTLLETLPQVLQLQHMGFTHWIIDTSVIPHLRQLTSLRLSERFVQGINGDTSVWDLLREAGIFLLSIHTDLVNGPLIRYLESYTGLRELVLSAFGDTSISSHANLIAWFFATIPRHMSLRLLTVSPTLENEWCVSSHTMQAIKSCKELKSLSVAIRTADVSEPECTLSINDLLRAVFANGSIQALVIDSAPSRYRTTRMPTIFPICGYIRDAIEGFDLLLEDGDRLSRVSIEAAGMIYTVGYVDGKRQLRGRIAIGRLDHMEAP